MGFEGEAITIASHITLIAALSALIVRVLRSELHGIVDRAVGSYGLTLAVALGAGALLIERSYYIAARTMKHNGVDLYMMHPVPELLSLIVACGIYVMMVPLILASSMTSPAAFRRIAVDVAALVLLFAVSAMVLH